MEDTYSKVIVDLLNSAQGIWKDSINSQVKLFELITELEKRINEINQLTAIPVFPHGSRQLASCLNRLIQVKNRLTVTQGRLNAISQKIPQQ